VEEMRPQNQSSEVTGEEICSWRELLPRVEAELPGPTADSRRVWLSYQDLMPIAAPRVEGGDAGQHADGVNDVAVVRRDVFRQVIEDRAHEADLVREIRVG
jgi:hypothetical protein